MTACHSCMTSGTLTISSSPSHVTDTPQIVITRHISIVNTLFGRHTTRKHRYPIRMLDSLPFRVYLQHVLCVLQQQIGLRYILEQCVLLLLVGIRHVALPRLGRVHSLHPSSTPLQNKSQRRHHVQLPSYFRASPFIHTSTNVFTPSLPPTSTHPHSQPPTPTPRRGRDTAPVGGVRSCIRTHSPTTRLQVRLTTPGKL